MALFVSSMLLWTVALA